MKQYDIVKLKLEGRSTDHIWLMEDGPDSHPIGVRMDRGDSGVVYLSYSQAKDLSEQLSSFTNAKELAKV